MSSSSLWRRSAATMSARVKPPAVGARSAAGRRCACGYRWPVAAWYPSAPTSSSADWIRIGSSTNVYPSACTAGPPITAVNATAPEGGCTQRSANMPAMAIDTASAEATTGSFTNSAHVTPTVAATRLPPMIDHGCASGLAGTANSSTAEAPMGATSKGISVAAPGTSFIIVPVKKMPISAPTAERTRSRQRTVTGAGTKLWSQWANAARDVAREAGGADMVKRGRTAIARTRPHQDRYAGKMQARIISRHDITSGRAPCHFSGNRMSVMASCSGTSG